MSLIGHIRDTFLTFMAVSLNRRYILKHGCFQTHTSASVYNVISFLLSFFSFFFFMDSVIICSCNLRVFQFLTLSLFMFGIRLEFLNFLKKNV